MVTHANGETPYKNLSHNSRTYTTPPEIREANS